LTANPTASKTAASVEGSELIVTRLFQAPRELVYKAWTDPRHLPQWWGPKPFTLTVADIEIKTGGVWNFTMHGPDGRDYPNKITFLEIEEPARIVYAHGDGGDDELFRTSVTFEQQNEATLLTMRMRFKSAEELERTVKESGAIEGAQSTLQRLEEQLPKITLARAIGQSFLLDRIFDAPRELVFQAFAQSEHLKHWWGPRGWELPVSNMDFRPGGSWHYCMKCVDKNHGDFYGMESWGKTVYKEIVEGEKIVYVDYFSDAEGTESTELPPSETTLTFEERDGKTLVVSRTRYGSAEALKTVVDMGMEQGITETWDRLSEHLESLR